MPLSSHVDPDTLLASLWEHAGPHHPGTHHAGAHHYTHGSRYQASMPIPKFRIPDQGTDGAAVHQLIKGELDLDGKPNLNLASFVGTYMEHHADMLMLENISKNLADCDEYPAVMAIHTRCISMLAHLWNIPKGETAIGTATTGSSEAIHLGGLAMKRTWQEKRRAAGLSTEKPNILMAANAQVALEKFARYFEVEARILPVSEASHYCLDPEEVRKNVDENTIGVFVILGSTYTGHFEPVDEVSQVLDEYEKKTGHSIPIHVDGASGAMVAPFVGYEKKWAFDNPRVVSINTSGHKFGLVYAGLGWVLWRNESYLPKDLVFELHYLGGTEQTYTLSFSRPAAHVIGQYFNFLALGRDGYEAVMRNALQNARILSKALDRSQWYHCVSDIHRKKGTFDTLATATAQLSFSDTDPALYNPGLPVVAFRFTDEFKEKYPHIKQQSVSTLLRAKGYIIPNYTLPPTLQDIEILRVVVRETMSTDLLDSLVADILSVTETLMTADYTDLTAFAIGTTQRVERDAGTLGSRRGSLGAPSRRGSVVENLTLGSTSDEGTMKTIC